MTAPIHLIAKEVALAALKAHAEGRLSAQGPTPACRYRDKSGLPCAIGVVLTDECARSIGNVNVLGLVQDGVISADDVGALLLLQNAHDDWSNYEKEEGEAHFLAAARRIAGVDQWPPPSPSPPACPDTVSPYRGSRGSGRSVSSKPSTPPFAPIGSLKSWFWLSPPLALKGLCSHGQ